MKPPSDRGADIDHETLKRLALNQTATPAGLPGVSACKVTLKIAVQNEEGWQTLPLQNSNSSLGNIAAI